MKNMKKFIALACVATMLIPTVALADTTVPATSPTYSGDSVVENDNSGVPEYTAVVLPAIAEDDSTYDFKIDRDGLLSQYDKVNRYDSNAKGVYFNAEETAATIALLNSNKLYKKSIVEDNNLTNLKSVLVKTGAGDTGEAIATALFGDAANTYKFYAWSPVSITANGKGNFVEITAATINDYINVTVDNETTPTEITAIEVKDDNLSGDVIWDGKIYVETYEEITTAGSNAGFADTVKEYGITASDAGSGLYVSADSTAYTALAPSDYTYTAATRHFTSATDVATLENKSTHPVAVSVDVTVDAEGLTFSDDGDYTDDTDASIYVAVQQADKPANKAVVENGTATAYYILDRTTPNGESDLIRFQGAATEGSATGSHNYYTYEKPNVVGDSVSFSITATANQTEESNEAWDAYIEALNAENPEIEKPSISVVYTIIKVDETAENNYVDEAGKTYSTSASDNWAASFTATSTFVLNQDNTRYVVTPIPSGTTITSVTAYDASDYALNGSTATPVADLTSDFSKSATSGNVTVVVDTLETKLPEEGSYAIVIVMGSSTYSISYTVAPTE